MKLVSNFLLFAAMILLLLHHMLPHQHHGQACGILLSQEHNSTNLTDILRTVFHNVAPNIEAGQFQENEEKSILIKAYNTATIDKDDLKNIKIYTSLIFGLQREYYKQILHFFSNNVLVHYQNTQSLWTDLRAKLPLFYNTCVIFRAPPALV